MGVTAHREKLIRRVWAERGEAEWGEGIGPLTIDLPLVMMSPVPTRPIPTPDSLKFELRTSTVKRKPVNQIVCEGVVVKTIERTRD